MSCPGASLRPRFYCNVELEYSRLVGGQMSQPAAPAGDYGNADKVEGYFTIAKEGSLDADRGIDEEVFQCLKGLLPETLSGLKALDLGGGDARWSHYFHQELTAAQVNYVDSSSTMLALAQARKEECGLERLNLFQADARDVSCIETGSIDIALASFCLMDFGETDLKRVMVEIARTLRKGGELYVATNLVLVDDVSVLSSIKNEIIPLLLGTGTEQ
ncbi:MAG: class I SAM-dependent methyltransferase [Gemmatimonadales bacterium]|nr:MAG: class I SAM-dependent methyltransferase [Gemmatimonadales bacterium]